jgi:hypothetical protein
MLVGRTLPWAARVSALTACIESDTRTPVCVHTRVLPAARDGIDFEHVLLLNVLLIHTRECVWSYQVV